MEDCWIWKGAISTHGYGLVARKKYAKHQYAHRIAYVIHIGPVPDGHDIHHSCGNKACVNPEHLEALTHADHARLNPRASQMACKYGHDWHDPYNVYRTKCGHRYCGQCHRERQNTRRARPLL